MRAQIQSVTMNLFDGETAITVGPAQHLSIADLMQLMQPARIQISPKNDESRATGKSKKDASETDGASAVPDDSGGVGGGINKKQEWSNKDDTSKRVTLDMSTTPYFEIKQGDSLKIRLDIADIPAGGIGTISLRALDYCDGSTKKKILVFCSAPYSDE